MRSPLDIVVLGGDQALIRSVEKALAGKTHAYRYLPLKKTIPKEIFRLKPAVVILAGYSSLQKGMEGVRILAERLPKSGIMAIVPEASPRDIIRAYRAGMSELLLHPFPDAELRNALHRLLSRHRAVGFPGLLFYVLRKMKAIFQRKLPQFLPYELPAYESSLGLLPGAAMPAMATGLDPGEVFDLKVRFFGKLEIEYQGKPIAEPHGAKLASLLAYLLYHHRKPLHREALMAKFWGNSDTESARNSLNVGFYKIRKLLSSPKSRKDVLLHDYATYRINPQLSVFTDADAFMELWRKGRAVEQSEGLEAALPYYNEASGLYRGDFLENHLLEEWCESERDTLKETYLFILNRLSDYFYQQQSYMASVNVCRKILAKDPCLEETHQRLMVCYKNLGMRDKAIRQFYACEETLKRELSVPPSEYTRGIFQELSRG